MSVEYRADRKKWGYRFYLADKCFKKYVWETKTEAKKAEQQAQVEARKAPALQPTALLTASGAYLIASAERRRSKWRIDGLHSTFKAHIIPYFGEATLITDITPGHVENFITSLKRKGLKNKTVKFIVTNLGAMFNWAMEPREDGGPGLLDKNPVTKKVAKLIGSTRVVKRPINPRWFDIASAAIENKRDRAWFDVTRFVGMRKDEANRLQWSDIDWRTGKIRIPGTKTEESEAWLPAAPVALAALKDLYESKDRDPNSLYVFPGRSSRSKGKKIYSRHHIFDRIQRVTAIKKYLRQHPEASELEAREACKKDGFKGGLHLMPKDLRDYFCTEIAAKSNDANVAMRLMRHTSLATTTKYMRAVEARMRDAVQSLGSSVFTLNSSFGGDSGGDSMAGKGPETSHLAKLEQMRELAKMFEKYGFLKNNFASGSRIQNLGPVADCSRDRVPGRFAVYSAQTRGRKFGGGFR